MFQYIDHLLIVGLIMTAIGCQSAPKSKHESVIIGLQDPTVKCIGLGRDYHDVIERCGLITYAEIPATIEKNKRLAIKIATGHVYVIRCRPNVSWIGTLDDDKNNKLVAKCRNNRVRLYWKAPDKPVRKPWRIDHYGYVHTTATVYDGDRTQIYYLEGHLSRFASFTIEKNGDPISSDDLIENTVREISNTPTH